jgi:hypothetical protein
MKTGWKILIAAGVVLMLVSGQVLAQPWGNGPGWGPGFARGAGGPNGYGMGVRPYGPGPLGRGGPRAWRPPGPGSWGRGAWAALDREQAGIPGPLARRLGLTAEQRQKIRAIMNEAHSRIRAAIKEVLTEEQIRQLEQMRGQMRRFGGEMRGPGPRAGLGGPLGRRPQQDAGPGVAMPPRGWGRPGQPFRGGQGQGPAPWFQRGPQQPGAFEQPPAGRPGPGAGRAWNRGARPPERMLGGADPNQQGRRRQQDAGLDTPAPRRGQGRGPSVQAQRGPRQPGAPEQPPAGRRGPGAERPLNRGNPSLEQIFDEADANKDGALTKEEIRAFQEARRGNGPSGRQ